MKIGIVVPGFSAETDDWCIPALRDLVQRLAMTDDVRVITMRYPYRAGNYEAFGARVIALGGAQRRGPRSAEIWRQTLGALAREHRRQRFDLLHAFWASETGALTALAGRLLRVPSIVSLAGGELARIPDIGYGGQLARGERIKVRLAIRLAGVVTAGSGYLLAMAQPWLAGRPPGQIYRAPLGVDSRMYRPDPTRPPNQPPSIVQAASLSPVKDQATLIRAVARSRDRGLALSVDLAGDGPLLPRLRLLATSLQVDDRVRFQGEIRHDCLPRFYQRGDLFVLSSRHEAQSVATLEAAACGLSIVGTAVGVVPELAPEAALIVPPGDPDALADAIATALSDRAPRQDLGRAARARVESEFTLERCVARFREIYGVHAG